MDEQVSYDDFRESWDRNLATDIKGVLDGKPFIVHAITDNVGRLTQNIALLRTAHEKGFKPPEIIDLKDNPELINSKPIISTSILFPPTKLATFSPQGFILSANYESVINMQPKDAGTNFFNPKR